MTEVARPRRQATERRTQAARAAESREQLLAAAVELFAEGGYDSVSAGAIAERAGYVRSMVNTRFGDKQGLIDALLQEHWVGELVVAMPAAPDGLSALMTVFDRLEQFLREQPTRLRAFMMISFESVGPSSMPRSRVVALLDELQVAFARALRRGGQDGSLRQDISPDEVAERLCDIGVGMMYRWVLDPVGYPIAERVQVWRSEVEAAYGAG